MRIAYVSPRYFPFSGGVETHVRQIANRMARGGHAVEVLCQETDKRLPSVELIDGVTVRRFPVVVPAPIYAFAPGLWAYLRRHADGYDVVHAHSYHAFPALGAALFAAHELVFTPHYHGGGHRTAGKLLHIPYRLLAASEFKRASRVICVTESEAELVKRDFPFCSSRLAVIPNGVDVEELREAEPYKEERTVILSVGRLEEHKGLHRVVEAMAHLDEDYALRIIGEGPALRSLRDLAARLGVAGRVRVLGNLDDASLYRWYRTAAVYVSMSEVEAFGITLLEAMAARCGVVASDIPAHREIVQRVGAKRVALLPLHASAPELARAIAAAAQRQEAEVPNLPTWDSVAEQTLDVYRSLR